MERWLLLSPQFEPLDVVVLLSLSNRVLANLDPVPVIQAIIP
jgi:hypothetical protein